MNATQQIHGYTVKAHGTSEPIPDASGTGMIESAAPSGALAVGTGSANGPTVDEALQYADGLPADCWADRCIIQLAAEVVRQRAMNADMHRTVSGYLAGAEWEHWQHYHAKRFLPNNGDVEHRPLKTS